MVFDNLKNCELYYGMHPRFREAFDFIKKATAENLEIGKYEIHNAQSIKMSRKFRLIFLINRCLYLCFI